MNIIDTSNLTKSYAGFTAVSGVSLHIPKGTVYGFLGPNGAGKSTTMKMFLGLTKPTKGDFVIDGKKYPQDRIRILKEVGSFIEAPAFYGNLTGEENLDIVGKILGLPRAAVDDALELVGLTQWRKRLARKYSLGMKQRLGLASALIGRPPILILDEPTNGLDPDGIAQMRELFLNLKNQLGTTIIISSHILGEIQQTCDRVAFMAQGEIKAVKSMEEVNYGVDSMRKFAIECSDLQGASQLIGAMGIEAKVQNNAVVVIVDQIQVGEIVKALVENNIIVYTVNKIKRSLEDLYREVSK